MSFKVSYLLIYLSLIRVHNAGMRVIQYIELVYMSFMCFGKGLSFKSVN